MLFDLVDAPLLESLLRDSCAVADLSDGAALHCLSSPLPHIFSWTPHTSLGMVQD